MTVQSLIDILKELPENFLEVQSRYVDTWDDIKAG